MRSEFARIGGNYLRLVIGFVIGLLIVRQLLLYGSDIFNIFTIVTVGAGVGIMLRELLRIALTSHLSRAWAKREEDGGEAEFRQVFGQSMTLCALAALVGALLMAMVAWAIPLLAVEPENIAAAQIFVAARTAIMICTVAISPLLTMLLVMQKFGRMNLLMTGERIADFLAVLAPLIALAPGIGGADALIIFAMASAVLVCSLYLFAGWRITRASPRFLTPTWRWLSSSARKPILVSIGWALALVLSFNLYLRFDTFFINTHFGVAATIVFGLSVQLMGMVRQLTVGIVNGLDAVVAKLAFERQPNTDNDRKSQRIIALNSYLQTVLTLGAILFLALGARDLLQVWVGDRVDEPRILDQTATIATIMLIGMSARSLSEGWMATLNGTGKIGVYVRYTLIITALNPIGLLLAASIFGATLTLEHVAWAFAALLTISHLIIVPAIYVRQTGASLAALGKPMLRGVAAAPIALMLGWCAMEVLDSAGVLVRILALAGAIGVVLCVDIAIFAFKQRHLKPAKL